MAPTSTGGTASARSGVARPTAPVAGADFIPNVDACAVAVDGSHIYWADLRHASGADWPGEPRRHRRGRGVHPHGRAAPAVWRSTGSPSHRHRHAAQAWPPPPPDCTNATTLLVTCANLAGAPGVCGPGLELFPQCLLPVVPRTVCNAEGICSPSTPGGRPATGSCASMGQALPECNVPRREVPIQCHSGGFNLDPLPGQMCFAGAPVRSPTARRRAPRSPRRAASRRR